MPPLHPLLYPTDTLPRGRVLWLLTVEWAGYTLRISDDEVSVSTDGGDTLHYTAGLGEITTEEVLPLGGSALGTLSVPLEFFAPEDVDVPQLVEEGHALSAARAELARWVEGTAWEARRVVATGRLTDPIYGAADEPVSATLEERLSEDLALTGSPAAKVVGSNWPHADTVPTEDLGADYPIVFGRPGYVSTAVDADGWVTGSWGRWIDYRRVDRGGKLTEIRAIIAGHHVQVGSVWVNTDTDPAPGYRIRVANGYDDGGRPVAFLGWFYTGLVGGLPAPEDDWDAAGLYTYSGGATVYGLAEDTLPDSFNQAVAQRLFVAFRDEDDLTAGGLVQNGRLVRSATDVLVWLLQRMGRRVDFGRMQAAALALARFNIDGVIVERTSIWKFLQAELLPILPISLASGPHGIYAIPWRLDPSPEDASFFLDADADPEIDRISGVEYDDSERYTRIVVRYAYAFRVKAYTAEVWLGAKEDTEDAADATYFRVHPYCQASRDQLGELREKVIETAFVYEDATALAVAEAHAVFYALGRRSVRYRVPEARFPHVERGDIGLLTDSGIALSGTVVQVVEIVTNGSGWLELRLQRRERPGRRFSEV